MTSYGAADADADADAFINAMHERLAVLARKKAFRNALHDAEFEGEKSKAAHREAYAASQVAYHAVLDVAVKPEP